MNDLFAPLYEFLYYSVPFSDDLYSEGLYATLGLPGFIISLFFAVLFYYIINRPAFSRWYHWSIILLINFLVAFGLAFWLTQSRFAALGLDYHGEYYVFGLINGVASTIYYIILSFGMRWWSTNSKGTPIPH